jgi:hypothetical protein
MGHPTGRLIGTREPAAFDIERVLDAAARHGVAMEINAQPDRLDLNDVNARLASEKGIKLVIDTDAHAAVQLDAMRYGVFVARRAGLTRHDVLNTLPYARFRSALASRGRSVPEAAVAAVATHSDERSTQPASTASAKAEPKVAPAKRAPATRTRVAVAKPGPNGAGVRAAPAARKKTAAAKPRAAAGTAKSRASAGTAKSRASAGTAKARSRPAGGNATGRSRRRPGAG